MRRIGNIAHTVGDTFSASHVRRGEFPIKSKENPCGYGDDKTTWLGTMQQSYSMDVVRWATHAQADKQTKDWRFQCAVHNIADIIGLAKAKRGAATLAKTQLGAINDGLDILRRQLCEKVLVIDPETLDEPTGGADNDYSAAKKLGRAMNPQGVVRKEEFQSYIDSVGDRFWYAARDAVDLCGEQGSDVFGVVTAKDIAAIVQLKDDETYFTAPLEGWREADLFYQTPSKDKRAQALGKGESSLKAMCPQERNDLVDRQLDEGGHNNSEGPATP